MADDISALEGPTGPPPREGYGVFTVTGEAVLAIVGGNDGRVNTPSSPVVIGFQSDQRSAHCRIVSTDYRASTNQLDVLVRGPNLCGTASEPERLEPKVLPADKFTQFLRLFSESRLRDLVTRSQSGSLTNVELLALTVLAGHPKSSEHATPPLIDACLEEFGCGYRVPVRVVADRKRMKVVISAVGEEQAGDFRTGTEWTVRQVERIKEGVKRWLFSETDNSSALILPFPAKVQVFEFATDSDTTVEVKPTVE